MQEALRRGPFFEAILRNYRGELAECSQSNLFVVKDGIVRTPPLDAGLLAGITREFVRRGRRRGGHPGGGRRAARRGSVRRRRGVPHEHVARDRPDRPGRRPRDRQRRSPGPSPARLLEAYRVKARAVTGRAARPASGVPYVLDRRARAHQVAIAVRIVDPPHARPELVLLARTAAGTPPARACTGASRCRPSPPPPCAARSSARCPSDPPCRRSTVLDLLADRDHRVAEPIQFSLRFALGRLDHQRARHRERDRRRVESVVHQPLGHVAFLDARRP